MLHIYPRRVLHVGAKNTYSLSAMYIFLFSERAKTVSANKCVVTIGTSMVMEHELHSECQKSLIVIYHLLHP